MTPKQKATELLNKYAWIVYSMDKHHAKKCILIAVDEMIFQNGELYLNSLGDKTIDYYREKNAFLFKVKEELKKL